MAVGKMPPAASLHEDMVFTGSVERVAGWLRGADVAVVPLLDGGGTRMKIIDYFACSVPVVSTAKGIEGIEVSNGQEAVITDDWEQMADAIVELLQNPTRHADMAAAGRAFAEQLDWCALAEDYVSVFARA
jgi:glycosyltransferase involved in cell wall biosynthesis